MYKQLFFFLFIFSSSLRLQAQGVKFSAFQNFFVGELCNCLQSNPNLPAKSILYNKIDTCMITIMTEKAEDINNFAEEFQLDYTISKYENGRKIGKYLIYDSIDELIIQCPFYVATMKRYIKEEGTAKGLTPEKIDTALVTFKPLEAEMKTDAQPLPVFSITWSSLLYQGKLSRRIDLL